MSATPIAMDFKPDALKDVEEYIADWGAYRAFNDSTLSD